ncbi:MAG TPA: recombinase family protein [Planctomycetes bacterium]|nr:recombinase family protein [Planctomycetota bacterium]
MNENHDVKLAAGYLRKSTEEESRQVESFEGQKREIEKYAQAHGYVIVKWYREAYTGTEVKRRKVFIEMLEDAKTKTINFSFILCYDISRFGRLDNDEAGYYRHEFRKHGVEVVYVVENLQGDDTDDLIVSTKQWLAREYSRKIGEYVCRNIVSRSGDARAKAQAFNIGRAAPFGYDTIYLDRDGTPHTIVRLMPDRSKEVYSPDGELLRTLPPGTKFQKADTDLMALVPSAPDRVEVVQQVFRWYVEENLGQYAIVNRLNEALQNGIGLASPTGKHWSIGTVQQMLQNEHYAGNTVFNKRSMGKFFKLTAEDDGLQAERLPKVLPTTIRRNPKADWIVIEDTHEPIIPKDLFDSAKAKRRVRSSNSARSRRSLGSKYLFSGLLTCEECGHHFQGVTKKSGGNIREGYICGGYKLKGKHVCKDWFLPSDIIEPAVFKALEEEVKTLDISAAIGKAGEQLGNAPAMAQHHRAELEQKIAETGKRLDELLDCITPENKDLISEKMVALRKEQDRLKAELGNTAEIEEKAVASTKLVGRLVELAKEFRELWGVATVGEKKEFLSLLIQSISIQPKRKSAVICLTHKYSEAKALMKADSDGIFLFDGRGDTKQSERIVHPIRLRVQFNMWKPRCA